jgi:hypothetical protein
MSGEEFMLYNSQSTKLTREELYEQVWTTPTVQLARTYGISDVAIAKICKRHKVPKPPLGYWARKQYGHKVAQRPLPAVSDPALETVSLPKKMPAADQLRPVPQVHQSVAFEQKEENRITVPAQLDSPHPLVEKTERSISSAAADEKGIVRPRAKGCLDVAVGKASIDRAMRIMNALVKALEAREYPIRIVEDKQTWRTRLTVLNEDIAICLEEEVESKGRPPTSEQKRDLARWGRFYGHKLDYLPTGKLRLRIADGGYPGHRKSWSDTETRHLDGCLNKFVAGLVNAAQGSKRARFEAEQRHREYEEQRRQWREEEERKMREETRIKELDSLIVAWTRCQNIRHFIQAMEESAASRNIAISPESDLSLWLSWARERADRLDPLRSWSPVFKK